MSRISGVIVLAIVLLLTVAPAGLYAQRGYHSGGGTGSSTAVHTPPTSSFAPHPAPPVGRPAPGGHPAPVFASPGTHRPIDRPHRPIIVSQPYGYYLPYGYSSYSPYYPYFGPAPVGASAYAEPAYTYADQAYPQYPAATQAPAVSQSEADLSYQVGVLSQQLEQLRQEQAQRLAPSAPALSGTPAVLIFRDGHRQEIHNYAIVGDTLWVLDEKASTRISVADLDLEATQSENRSRGVRFPLPAR